ncbi:restriction endonuclease subunit S [Psychrobacter sp. AOP5-GZ1-6]|uniref:restriction endonuclease subunit S n=1 Tax=Psychrobacter sp. AOP5-GZ1-6 TaxID=3457649 RepID=UPI00402BBAE5
MNDLSYINKLLDGVEIKWRTLDEVANFNNGKGHEKHIVEDGEYIVVNSKFISTDGEVVKYSDEQICPLFADDILIVMSDLPNGKALAKTFFVEDSDKYTLNQRIGRISVKNNELLLPIFLYSYLNRTPQLIKHDNGVTQTNLRKNQILDVKIPIVPLNVQVEIVRILNTFTKLTLELTSELTSELTARKQQYTYYREQLLTFAESKVEWKLLGEVAEYSKTRISYELLNEENYVGVNNLLQDKAGKEESSHVPTQGNSTKYQDNDILIGNIRPYLKKIWQADCIGGTNGDVLVVHRTDEAVHPRYLYQILADDNFFNYNMQHAKGAKMPRGDKARIMEYKIPIPSLPEQKRIVAILDKFDALTTSLIEGLPREIELRQQQYEYYRELLLSFPKAEVADHD